MERLPLFDDYFLKNLLQPHIQRIAAAVEAKLNQVAQPGWMTGLAGMAVFLFEYRDWTAKNDLDQGVGDPFPLLNKIVDLVNAGFRLPTYAAGLSGIIWSLHYLGRRGFITTEEATVLDPAIPHINKWAENQIVSGNADVLHGGLGPCLIGSTITWNPDLDAENTDWGLAHGLTGQAAAILEADSKKEESIQLAQDLIKKILDQADWSMQHGSVFPTKTVKGKPEYPSRLAWCYGDVGMALGLLRCAEKLGNDELKQLSIRTLEMAADRHDQKNTRIVDPYLCHGKAGLALLFFKAYILSNNDKLKKAAQYWSQQTIDYLEKNEILSMESETKQNLSVLEGLAGIGLTLMAIDTGHLPGWEAGLLI